MNKHLKSSLTATGVALLVLAFQNCGGGDLPSDATDVNVANVTPTTPAIVTPLKLQTPNSVMGPNSTMALSATGGTPPYTFSVTSGPVSVSALAGLVTSAGSGGAVVVRVTDSAQLFDEGSFNVDLTLAPVVHELVELATAGTTNWTIKNYNTITIEAWGAGGGGGGWTGLGAGDGVDGGGSTVVGNGLNLLADGGKKGRACATGNSGTVSAPGAGGALPLTNGTNVAGVKASDPTFTAIYVFSLIRTLIPSKGGAGANGGAGGDVTGLASTTFTGGVGIAPGGGGGGSGYYDGSYQGCMSGGGGGGSYFRITYARGSLTVGSSLALKVGAGGATTYSGSFPSFAGAGAPGKIKIDLN